MIKALAGIFESFSVIGKAIASFFQGLLDLIAFIGQGIVVLHNYINLLLPLPLRALALAIVSVSVIYIIVGRQH